MRSAVSQALGRPAVDREITLRPLAAHQTNRLYDIHADGTHLIAKEYLRADRPDAPAHEYAALRHVESLKLAPEPLFFDPRVGPVLVYRYMEGDMWDRRVPSGSELRALAELWLRVQELNADALWVTAGQAAPWPAVMASLRALHDSYARWASVRSAQHREAARQCLQAVEDAFAGASPLMRCEAPPLCFCRSDARFANVITRPGGRLGLVDWEDSGLCDPAREVADLLMHPNQEDLLDWQGWQPFLSAYIVGRGDDPDFELRLKGYLAIFPVFWLGILLADGTRRIADGTFEKWMINEMEPNTRLRRYLARAKAWPGRDPGERLSDVADVVFF